MDKPNTRFKIDANTGRPLLRHIVFEEQQLIRGQNIALPTRYYGLIDGNILLGMLNPGNPSFLGVFCLVMEDSLRIPHSPNIVGPNIFRGLVTYQTRMRMAYEILLIIVEVQGDFVTGKYGIKEKPTSTTFTIRKDSNWVYSKFTAKFENKEIFLKDVDVSSGGHLFPTEKFDIYQLGEIYFGLHKSPMASLYLFGKQQV